MQPTLIVVAGSTAVGKTATAIALAQMLGTEIISADSRQCYTEMTIGTAKPSFAELAMVPHHFINTHSIHEHVTAGNYEPLALNYCQDIFSRANTAILCGGTGLYIKALCEGIDTMPDTDPLQTKLLQQEFEQKGLAWLQLTAQQEDPAFYSIAEQQNPARLIRALAFLRSTGTSITHFRTQQAKARPFRTIKIGLELPRPILYDRINARVDIMLQEGLWQEAVSLYPFKQLKNLQTVGYQEIFDCIDGSITKEASVALIKQHTRNYAKRQLTWFKKDAQFQWFEPTDLQAIKEYILQQLSKV
jgi:tRNA dimethylallyltransferase